MKVRIGYGLGTQGPPRLTTASQDLDKLLLDVLSARSGDKEVGDNPVVGRQKADTVLAIAIKQPTS